MQLNKNVTIQERIVQFYRSWVAWAQKINAFENALFVVIDDLSRNPISPIDYKAPEEIKNALEFLIEETMQNKAQLGTHYGYSLRKLKQSLNYLSRQPNMEISKKTLEESGTKWFPVSNEDLILLKKELDESVSKIIKAKIASQAQINSYLYEPLSNGDVAKRISHFAKPHLSRFIKQNPFFVSFNFDTKERESQNAAWRNMVTYNGSRFELIVNTSSHHTYTQAAVESIALHEICGHMIHLAKLATCEELQKFHPHLLCISIHTLDSYLAEGIAQLLAALCIKFCSTDSSLVEAGFKLLVLQLAVRHVNILDQIIGKLTLEGAVKRHIEFLGGEPEPIGKAYAWILENPFFCFQVLNYHSSYTSLRPVLSLDKAAQKPFLKKLLAGFYTHEDIDRLVKNAMSHEFTDV